MRTIARMEPNFVFVGIVAASLLACSVGGNDNNVLTPLGVAKIRSAGNVVIGPSGQFVAYVLGVPQDPEKNNGKAWRELHVVDAKGNSRVYVGGKVRVSKVNWMPDGKAISYLAKRRDDKHTSLYIIPIDGGESRRVLSFDTSIAGYSWAPDGQRVAFLAKEKVAKEKSALKKKGFDQEVYEEELRPTRVWIADVNVQGEPDGSDKKKPRLIKLDGSASELHWSPGAKSRLVVALAPRALVDDYLMQRQFHVVDTENGAVVGRLKTEGKLGSIAWSPNGHRLALIASKDIHDPQAGRLMAGPAEGGALRNLLPNYMGHVSAVAWKDNDSLIYAASKGVQTTIGTVSFSGKPGKDIIPLGKPIVRRLSYSRKGAKIAFGGESPRHPSEVFVTGLQGNATRVTRSNPWLDKLPLAKQRVIRYKARDGEFIDGLLIEPLVKQKDKRYPLIVQVHGGPEAHYSDGWLTRYLAAGQVAAARGYAVFYPNYRGSTGRGVAFAKAHQGDYAGKEFNDLVDGVKYLVSTGLVDEKKVGITGGSYGGYAAAWGATKLTKHFAASVMFVGISDQISKVGTTDIPNEMHLVHARSWPWQRWDWFRERSPIYHAEAARTPILILHGKSDPRVHPTQSIILYRYLKTLGKVPVRLVLYPKEGHGNRRAAARYDYNLRMLRWMDHYLKGPGGAPPNRELDYGFAAGSAKKTK
jgi:dipeptidyl aminopeptidase/acylaminoacyl peptidase